MTDLHQAIPSRTAIRKVIEVKLDTAYFDEVLYGRKTFEIRLNDRGYQQGDVLHMSETKNHGSTYLDRKIRAEIGYVHSGLGMDTAGCGHVVLSLLNVAEAAIR